MIIGMDQRPVAHPAHVFVTNPVPGIGLFSAGSDIADAFLGTGIQLFQAVGPGKHGEGPVNPV